MISKLPLENCKIIPLPKIRETRGNLTFIEGNRHVPFEIARVYYLYDVPSGSERGGHAHKELHQLIIAVSGSFDVLLSDAKCEKSFSLNSPSSGLYVDRMVWRELRNFSAGAVSLVCASHPYDELDYFRDKLDFLNHEF